MTRQRPNERFTSFLARWKGKAAQVIDLPPYKSQVRIMRNNMSRQYHDSLYFQGMTTYDSLIKAATRIEDAIYNGTHGSQVKEADPKGKKIALGGTSKNSEVNVLSDGKPKTPRTLTPLGITLSRALKKLQKHGVLTPLPPSPPPDPLPPRYKANAYCKYHQTNGQNTDRCLRVFKTSKTLLIQGKLSHQGQTNRPNVTTNPLPDLRPPSSCQYKHDRADIVELGSVPPTHASRRKGGNLW